MTKKMFLFLFLLKVGFVGTVYGDIIKTRLATISSSNSTIQETSVSATHKVYTLSPKTPNDAPNFSLKENLGANIKSQILNEGESVNKYTFELVNKFEVREKIELVLLKYQYVVEFEPVQSCVDITGKQDNTNLNSLGTSTTDIGIDLTGYEGDRCDHHTYRTVIAHMYQLQGNRKFVPTNINNAMYSWKLDSTLCEFISNGRACGNKVANIGKSQIQYRNKGFNYASSKKNAEKLRVDVTYTIPASGTVYTPTKVSVSATIEFTVVRVDIVAKNPNNTSVLETREEVDKFLVSHIGDKTAIDYDAPVLQGQGSVVISRKPSDYGTDRAKWNFRYQALGLLMYDSDLSCYDSSHSFLPTDDDQYFIFGDGDESLGKELMLTAKDSDSGAIDKLKIMPIGLLSNTAEEWPKPRSRTTIGVGEEVYLNVSPSDAVQFDIKGWNSLERGSIENKTKYSAMLFAEDIAGDCWVYGTTLGGLRLYRLFKIIAPENMENSHTDNALIFHSSVLNYSYTEFDFAGFWLRKVQLLPKTVNFSHIQIFEVPSAASNIRGQYGYVISGPHDEGAGAGKWINIGQGSSEHYNYWEDETGFAVSCSTIAVDRHFLEQGTGGYRWVVPIKWRVVRGLEKEVFGREHEMERSQIQDHDWVYRQIKVEKFNVLESREVRK